MATSLGVEENFESISKCMVLVLLVPFIALIFFLAMEESVWLCRLDTKICFQLEVLLLFTRNLVLHIFRIIQSSWVFVVSNVLWAIIFSDGFFYMVIPPGNSGFMFFTKRDTNGNFSGILNEGGKIWFVCVKVYSGGAYKLELFFSIIT